MGVNVKSQNLEKKQVLRAGFLSLLFLFFMTDCGKYGNASRDGTSGDESYFRPTVKIDLEQIRERGKLVAITGYSSTSYFVYRGKPMGYEYELLNRFADYLGVELEILVAEEMDNTFEMLNRGEGDIIAYSLTVTKDRKNRVQFTRYHNLVKQVLVQRKPENWRKKSYKSVEEELIRNPIELEGKTIYVRKNSSYEARLKNLSEEIGGEINIVEAPGKVGTEDLIRMVADGKIDYTVADENLALINKTYYENLDVKTAVSFPQKIAWAVRKNSPRLLNAVNEWMDGMRETRDYFAIYSKYYKNRKAYKRRLASDFFSLTGNRISKYDELLKVHGELINWDWRLLASQIFQESRFNPYAQSWAGAKGLMQLIPATAKRFGVANLYDPRQSVEAGTRYLEWLNAFWKPKIPGRDIRIKFVLASYNVGPGHVEDARRLAEKYGADPDKWEGNVAKYLLLKSSRKFYNDDVVKFGYCRGREPYNYVKEVLKRFQHYTHLIGPQQAVGANEAPERNWLNNG